MRWPHWFCRWGKWEQYTVPVKIHHSEFDLHGVDSQSEREWRKCEVCGAKQVRIVWSSVL